MYIGRYYFDKKKWIAAINRFKTVVDDYETTIYVEEALHRLVEVYYIIGLKDEAKKYAKLLDIIINLLNGMKNLIVYLINI
jgi:outer membrane protein assembly factor BamD